MELCVLGDTRFTDGRTERILLLVGGYTALTVCVCEDCYQRLTITILCERVNPILLGEAATRLLRNVNIPLENIPGVLHIYI